MNKPLLPMAVYNAIVTLAATLLVFALALQAFGILPSALRAGLHMLTEC